MNFFEKLQCVKEDNHLVGMSVVSYQNNEFKDYYLGEAYENYTMHSDVYYRIASISKVVVAIGILCLLEEGKVDLDEDISKYLGFTLRNPNHPNDIITLKMLMTQTSSITDGFDDEEMTNDERIDGYNGVNRKGIDCKLEDLLINKDSKYYSDLTFAKYAPGTRFCYSNFGCGILACIIERVTKISYDEYLNQKIFSKLNIKASFYPNKLADEEIISAYNFFGGKKELCRNKELFISKMMQEEIGQNYRGPAGGLFIKPKDLALFMKSLTENDGVILSKETRNLMLNKIWSITNEERLAEFDYYGSYQAKGLQVAIWERGNHVLYGHTGSAYGVRTIMAFDPGKKAGLIFMTNGGIYKTAHSGFAGCIEDTLKVWENTIYDEEI